MLSEEIIKAKFNQVEAELQKKFDKVENKLVKGCFDHIENTILAHKYKVLSWVLDEKSQYPLSLNFDNYMDDEL
jgi:hypothetical protein